MAKDVIFQLTSTLGKDDFKWQVARVLKGHTYSITQLRANSVGVYGIYTIHIYTQIEYPIKVLKKLKKKV